MSETGSASTKFRFPWKWPLRAVVALFVLLVLAAICVAFLPSAVSTDWFRTRLTEYLTDTMGRGVGVEGLHWSWSQGILLQGISIAEDPSFGDEPLLQLRSLRLDPSVDSFLHPVVFLNMSASGLNANWVRDKTGRSNLDALLARFASEEESESSAPTKGRDGAAFSLPVEDLEAHVNMEDLSLKAEDRASGHAYSMSPASMLLDIPSLRTKPVTFRFEADHSMDGRDLPPVRMEAVLGDLIDGRGRIVPSRASVRLDATLPGITVKVDGALEASRMEADMHLDLTPLTETVRPFFPAVFPETSGTIALRVQGVFREKERGVDFSANLDVRRLSAEGGPLGDGRLGPLDLTVTQAGSVGLDDSLVEMKVGEAHLMQGNRIKWQGDFRKTEQGKNVLNLHVGPAELDLGELLVLAKDFAPDALSLSPKGVTDSASTTLWIEKMDFVGEVPDGAGRLGVEGVVMTLPFLDFRMPAGSIQVREAVLRVIRAETVLNSQFPQKVFVEAGFDAESLGMAGDRPVRLNDSHLDPLRVTVAELNRTPASLFGISGTVDFEESLSVKNLFTPSQVQVAGLAHSLKGRCVLEEGPVLSVVLDRFKTDARSVTSEVESSVQAGLNLELPEAEFKVTGPPPFRIDVPRLKVRLKVDPGADLSLDAAASDLGLGGLNLRGGLNLDVGRVLSLVQPASERRITAAGKVGIDWDFKGRVPGTNEVQALKTRLTAQGKSVHAGEFLERLDASVNVSDVGFDLSSSQGRFRLEGMETAAPIVLFVAGKPEQVRLRGKVRMGRLLEVPSIGKLEPPLEALLSLDAALDGLNTLRFEESLRLDQFNLTQEFKVFLDNILDWIHHREEGLVASALRFPALDLGASLRLAGGPGPMAPLKNIRMSGTVEGGLDLSSHPEREEAVARIHLTGPDLNLEVDPSLRVVGLESHVSLEKRYKLLGVRKPPEGTSENNFQASLSSEVLQPPADSKGDAREDVLSTRPAADLRGRFRSDRSLAFEMLNLSAGGLDLSLAHHEMDLSLNNGLPEVEFFQLELLGGTLAGSLGVSKRNEVFVFDARAAFSGINAKKLVAGEALDIPDEEAEMSGELFLEAPLLQETERLIENLQITIHLSHIGSRTLERFLYGLDPYESNETMVKQRALLRLGSPRWIRMEVAHGALSLRGEVEVKGALVELPKIDRLNLAALPGMDKFATQAAAFGTLNEALRILSADGIRVDPKEGLRFVQSRS